MLKADKKCIYIPSIIIILTILFNAISKTDAQSKNKEINKVLSKRLEYEASTNVNENNNYIDGDSDVANYKSTESTEGNNIEAGYYDSDGNTVLNKFYDKDCYNCKNKNKYTYDEMMDYNKNTCRKPTIDNPAMNPSITDFSNGDIPVACNADDDEIKDDMNKKIDTNLFKNVEDVWNIKNSQRQFYTVPRPSIPNNRKDLVDWLYKIPKTCKEGSENCVFYEDLRYKR